MNLKITKTAYHYYFEFANKTCCMAATLSKKELQTIADTILETLGKEEKVQPGDVVRIGDASELYTIESLSKNESGVWGAWAKPHHGVTQWWEMSWFTKVPQKKAKVKHVGKN